MNRKRKTALRILAAVLMVSGSICFVRNDFEIAKNLDIYATLMRQLNENYVDDLNIGDLVRTSIDAMLEELDPYTVYYPESDLEEFRLMTTGQYGGIGALIQQDSDYVIVSEPYENTPAMESGLQAGDRILAIDGKAIRGKSVSDVSTALKGQPGTTVRLTIQPYGHKTSSVKEITRKEIKLPSITYTGMLREGIGYIRLAQFTEHAGKEVKEAFLKLKEQQMRCLVLDLRGNGGGLLNEAVHIVSLFVPNGELVVSTKGKQQHLNQQFYTPNEPVDTKIPIAVLVDGHSASASEIVAGALQDLDRAVIIGERTFGKGLVQNVLPLSYNTQMKVTVSKYYIPSGRCIQKIDYQHKDSNGVNLRKADSNATAFQTRHGRTVYDYGGELKVTTAKYYTPSGRCVQAIDYARRREDGSVASIPDSLTHEFKTAHGRTVRDGGGITPDVDLTFREYSRLTYSLVTYGIIEQYALEFVRKHASIPPVGEFHLGQDDYEDFVNFAKDKEFDYRSSAKTYFDRAKEELKRDGLDEVMKEQLDALDKMINMEKVDFLHLKQSEIVPFIEEEIVVRYYFQEAGVQIRIRYDDALRQAMASPLIKQY